MKWRFIFPTHLPRHLPFCLKTGWPVILGFWLILLLTGNSHAQQLKQAGIRLDLNLTSHGIDRSEISRIDIEVKDKLDQDQSPRRIRVVVGQNMTGSGTLEEPQQIDIDQQIPLEQNDGRWFKVLRSRKSEDHPKLADTFFQLPELSWPDKQGFIVFTTSDNDLILSFKDLRLPPSVYKFTASLSERGKADLKIIETEREIIAGQNYAISTMLPEKPGASGYWEAIKDKFFNKEGILVTIIIGLVGILIAVLRDKISAAINRFLDKLGRYGSGKLAERRFLNRYLDFITFNHKYLKLVGFSTAGISRPLLQEVFVSLRISSLSHHGNRSSRSQPGEESIDSNTVSFATALKQNRKMVILGGPGAGKTTTLSYALLTFAQKKGKERFGIEEDLLPIFIPLRRLSNTTRTLVEDLTDSDTQILSADILKECPPGYFETRLDKGECLMLLDGLDEVVDEATLQQVATKINNLLSRYPKNRYVVTCRIAGWKPDILSGEFVVLQTQVFNRDEIQRFVIGWHKAVITQSEYSRLRLDIPDEKKFTETWEEYQKNTVKPAIELQSRKLINAINANNRILAIAVNPMLLSLISLVHYNRDILPRGRTILYSQCIELLIEAWDRTKNIASRAGVKITAEQKEAILREIAFDFQLQGKGEDTRENVEQLIRRISQRLGISVPAGELLSDIEKGSGLLIERSIDVFGFSHLTLQEYLVAKHIQINHSLYTLLVENFDRQEWREVILLYAGLMADATRLVRDIAGRESLDRQILAGYCIGDALQCDGKVAQMIVDSLLDELSENNDQAEELIIVLSAIAADYDGQPANVREDLSRKLIEATASPFRVKAFTSAPATRVEVLHSMSILGRAKVTHALPFLIKLISYPLNEIRHAAITSLIAFGDLALPALEQDFDERLAHFPAVNADRVFRNIAHQNEAEIESQLSERSALARQFEFMLYMRSFIEILAGINTGQSAKLLLKPYNIKSAELDVWISLNLARMLANPFVEADLHELSFAELPKELRNVVPDRDGWVGGGVESRKNFLIVDTTLRESISWFLYRSLAELIYAHEYPNEPEKIRPHKAIASVKGVSFKILFPSFLRTLRFLSINGDTLFIRGDTWLFLYDTIGFDDPLPKYIYETLFLEVATNHSLTLGHALRESRTNIISYSASPGEENPYSRRRNRYEGYFAFYFPFILYMLTLLILSGVTAHYPSLAAFGLVISFISVLLMIVYLKRPKAYGVSLKDHVLLNPLTSIQKILPYLSAGNVRAKFFLFHLAFFCCVCIPITLLSAYLGFNKDGRSIFYFILLFVLPYALFLIFSILYFRDFVISRNPIRELILSHPEGRKLLNTT